MAAQQNPEQLKQLEQQFMQLKGNLEDETQKPTRERVEQFLKDYRTTAFVLDIETDSTIQANEDAEKQRRGEFLGMLAQLLPQLAALIAQEPGAAEFAGELLKFAVAPFRVGRSLDGSLDNLVQQVEAKAAEMVGKPDPKLDAEQKKVEAQTQIEMQKMQLDKAKHDSQQQLEMAKLQANNQLETQKLQGEFRIAMFEAQAKKEENTAKAQATQAKMQMDAQKHQQSLVENNQKMALQTQAAQQKQVDAQSRADDMAQRRAMADRSQVFKERQAAMKPFPTVKNG